MLAWVALAVFMMVGAPSLKDAGSLDMTSFLPEGAESLRVKELTERYFPAAGAVDTGTIVFYNQAGLSDQDISYAQEVREWLLSEAAPPGIQSVTSIFDQPQLKQMLVSPDNTTMLMQLGFSETAFETKTMETVRSIRSHLDGPTGLEIYVSGQGGIATDLFESLTTSIKRTTWITIALVIVLLLLIYRSPVASLIPLMTIGVAFLVARGALGYLAQAGVALWSQVDAFLIVLIFGVGTDYCLFIVSRFREELRRREDRFKANATTKMNSGLVALEHFHEKIRRSDDHFKANVVTMTKIGAVITASATAVIIGLAGLGVGRLEMLRTMGPALGLAIFITLLAALTLTPALVSLLGRHLFWPLHNNLGGSKVKRTLSWDNIARYTTRHPIVVALVVVVVLLVPYAALPNSKLSFNILSELPKDMDSRAGFEVLEQHYDAGEMMPLTALIVPTSKENLTDPTSLAALATISDALRQVDGVKKVQSIVQPNGTGESPGEVKVSGQLKMLQDKIISLAPKGGNPAGFLGTDTANTFSLLDQYLVELGQAFPWVQEETSYQAIGRTTQELKQALAQMNEATLQELLPTFVGQLENLEFRFRERGDPYFLPQSLLATMPDAQGLLDVFFSPERDATRLYVVLTSYPCSLEAFETVHQVRSALNITLANTSLKGGEAVIGGATAELADVQQVIDEDFNLIMVVLLVSIFIVLALLLRSLVSPLYLLGTVMLSYGTTLGIVTWLYNGVLGHDGLNYIVPIILLVLLVALGSDYNIFLTSRIREEWQINPSKEGIRVAATTTGGIITACGIILAGTFAALTSAPIQTLSQVGAALAIGILVDTFLVRALLVPAIAAMLGRWNWWPMRHVGQ